MWRGLVLATGAIVFAGSGCGDDADEMMTTPTATRATQTATQSPGPTTSVTADATTPAGTPTPQESDAAWATYSDASGISFLTPPGLTTSESTSPLQLRDGGTVEVRTVVLRNSSGDVVLSLSVAPNPEARAVAGWVETYPGWPGDSTEVDVADTLGLLFEEDQAGDANATVYFAREGIMFGLRGKTGTTSGSSGVSPPTISRAEFDRVWQGIEFN